ncbi:uncharacterized protein LOC118196793 [Stegodyphus dumicola]|uniref:uncharacterized protein LOC118196793 n=1 Tax=Stegodyphus dumicola TaxID=202533 RepID=UPI0015A7A867|nr:uncharacterized protein LOC118196793 [Stegodyphus dumicola]
MSFLYADRIKGQWISDSGDKLNISAQSEPGLFTGSNCHSEIIGHSDGSDDFEALGFVSPQTSKKFKVWAGHLYDSGTEKKLETSWLTHEFRKDCQNPRHLVHFGVDHYSHAGKNEGSALKEESLLEKIKNFFRSVF